MDKKTILIEIVVAIVSSIVIGFGFVLIGMNLGGNNPNIPTFLSLQGYEAGAGWGAMIGYPIGGIVGVYLVRKFRSTSSQKMRSAVWIGFVVGLSLFLLQSISPLIDFLKYGYRVRSYPSEVLEPNF